MNRYEFTQVDVFTDTPLKGNPLAVVHGADALSEAQMQAFARWTNLSETAFLLQPTEPDADYRVRIFTPAGELPFAGHPTLGSCHAWLQAGGVPKLASMVMQECDGGLVRIRLDGGDAAFAAPALRSWAVETNDLTPVLAALGVSIQQVRAARWLDNGPIWLGLLLDSAQTVLALEPDHSALKALCEVGVIGAYEPGALAHFEVRAFAASQGIVEDPVTGSLNASLAQWLMAEGLAPKCYVASQGARLGRAGRVALSREGDTVWVGGRCVSCVRGQLTL